MKNLLNFFNFEAKKYPTKIITSEIGGGIGNQLFLIAVALSYAWEHSLTPVFKRIKKSPSRVEPRPTYWNNIFRKINTTTRLPSNLLIYKDKQLTYHKIPNPTKLNIQNYNGIILNGFYQSAKYFDNYRKKIIPILYYISLDEKEYIKKKHSIIFDDNKITIAVHIRRDDNIKRPIPLFTPYLWNTDYYKKSIDYFQKMYGKEKILIVGISDDINWTKNYLQSIFPILNFYFPSEKDYLDLYLMSCCNHQIISNSTFSWWAAYLNNYPKKIIIAPKKWFGPKGPPIWKDIYMDEWILI